MLDAPRSTEWTASGGWRSPVNWRRGLAAIVSSLAGLTFGYDLGALSGATQGLLETYTPAPWVYGLTVSASLWGALCASFFAGGIAEEIGRRRLLVLASVFYATPAVLLALPLQWPWILVLLWRLISGISIGGLVVACPLYLAEIAPRQYRGRFVGLFQLQIGVGVFVAFVLSALLAKKLPETAEWKACFGLGAVPPVVLLALLHWLPEVPQWLRLHGRRHDANMAAASLGLTPDEWLLEQDLLTRHPSACSNCERLFKRAYLRPLFLATCVALFNQLCGVTVVRVYLLDILSRAGLDRTSSHSYGVMLALLNVVALLAGMALIDRVGRRPLLITGSSGMALCLFALVLALRAQPAPIFYFFILLIYNTCFACSQGAVAWVYLSEIFPSSVRGKGQSFGATVHWIANGGLIWMFPILEGTLPQASFMLFAGFMLLQILIVVFWYPETKGIRLGEISSFSPEERHAVTGRGSRNGSESDHLA